MTTIYQIALDENDVVRSIGYSNVLSEGNVEIDEETFRALDPKVNRARYVDGEIIDLDIPAAVPTIARVASVEAMAELLVTPEGEVTGVDTAVNIGAAFPLTPDIYLIYFATPQPDTGYLAFVRSPGFNVDVTWREADYFELQVTDRLTGEPATPSSLSITVQRVR